ncbi:MAG: respiratory nitrate reductase subunit gamma [Gammaproteobacteria bacterium]|nr:respiratory nitrate reductase subunit gamma [Gammaproteobacteria bacterium]MDH5614599.1 respiratory nitrate reductase subunit gamma [Gammaproteobacteria bacterium]
MSLITTIYTVLFYFATAILIVGVARKIYIFASAPAPLKIPTTPAPTTRSGVVYRLLREVILFESLFKSNKWIWLFGWTFHMAMWAVLARHLRYFMEPVAGLITLIQPIGIYAGFGMLIGLIGLFGRRIFVERIRYISAPSDYLMLLLIIGIAVTGLLMKFVEHTDIVAVKAYTLGLVYFDIQPMPEDPILMVHLASVALLMIIFPISKLLHAPGVFFSPTRNQVDNPREQRHLSPWAAQLESKN